MTNLNYGKIIVTINGSGVSEYEVYGFHLGKVVFVSGYIICKTVFTEGTLIGFESTYVPIVTFYAPISSENSSLCGYLKIYEGTPNAKVTNTVKDEKLYFNFSYLSK